MTEKKAVRITPPTQNAGFHVPNRSRLHSIFRSHPTDKNEHKSFIITKLLLFLQYDYFSLMDRHFEILFLEEAYQFLSGLERKHYEKILYNIRKSQVELDSELFKKISDDIWEFRTLYQGLQYRLFAFWDKTSTTDTLVVSTHGFIKKRSKVPDNEIQKAVNIRTKYLADKQVKNKKK